MPDSTSRIRWVRIIPAVFLMYTISYFDRVNIGLALPGIIQDLGITPSEAGLAGGIFFWGYTATFLAAGWLAPRFGARRMVLFSLIAWGAFAMLTGLVRNLQELIVVRFLLGAAEGPVWTSTSMLLAQWFLKSERARAFGLWNLCIPIGAMAAGPVSGLILAHWDWRTMLVVEGLPAWIWAIVWWRVIPNRMEDAAWLPEQERTQIATALAEEQSSLGTVETGSWHAALRHRVVWLLLGGFSLINMLNYGFTLWLPSAIQSVSSLGIASVGLLSAMPYVAGIAGLLVITRSSDRRQERRLHTGLPMILIGLLLLIGVTLMKHSVVGQMATFTLMGFFFYMYLPLIFTLLTEVLPRHVAIPGISFVGGIGNLFGGFLGPAMVGWLNGITADFVLAFILLAAGGMIGGFLVLATKAEPRIPPRTDRRI
ncbi:Sugar phosphate permease [uncultured Defluviicoccus sp.]|uniref:Sugar phosphate permease n=1 Tax=metagenome TaxID=256318 RepID=A0A380TFZ0_9ZZZZ|nr:Sugar phosphate permease [uncultured Defluviicoccus sp.]